MSGRGRSLVLRAGALVVAAAVAVLLGQAWTERRAVDAYARTWRALEAEGVLPPIEFEEDDALAERVTHVLAGGGTVPGIPVRRGVFAWSGTDEELVAMVEDLLADPAAADLVAARTAWHVDDHERWDDSMLVQSLLDAVVDQLLRPDGERELGARALAAMAALPLVHECGWWMQEHRLDHALETAADALRAAFEQDPERVDWEDVAARLDPVLATWSGPRARRRLAQELGLRSVEGSDLENDPDALRGLGLRGLSGALDALRGWDAARRALDVPVAAADAPPRDAHGRLDLPELRTEAAIGQRNLEPQVRRSRRAAAFLRAALALRAGGDADAVLDPETGAPFARREVAGGVELRAAALPGTSWGMEGWSDVVAPLVVPVP